MGGTILLHNGDTEKGVFETAKVIVDKREAKEKEDEKLEKLRKMIENQNDCKFKGAKQRAKSHRDYLDKKFEKIFEAQQKQIETSRIQVENYLSVVSSTMETIQTMQKDQQSII